MGFPEQERFTVEDLAGRWQQSPEYVAERISRLQLTHITLVEKLGGGSLLTRHLYFDEAAWTRDYGNKIEDLQRQAECNGKKHYARVLAGAKASRNKHARLLAKRIKSEYETVRISKTSYNIGPEEVANLWDPEPKQNEWKWRDEHVQVFIPRSAVESFERKHAIRQTAQTQRAEKAHRTSMPDLSTVVPDKWYPAREAARFLGMNLKYLQNDLLPSTKLRSKKRGARYAILGKDILSFAETYLLES